MSPDLQVPTGATWQSLATDVRALLGVSPPQDSSAPPDTAVAEAPAAVILATSGSSGNPKRVRLTGTALRASGMATAQVLGGHGRWILGLATHHVAGFQVVARSMLARTEPVVMDPTVPFTPEGFAAAIDELLDTDSRDAPRTYASLVPTQLHRILTHADPAMARHAARLDTILLGGAAADPTLLRTAAHAGIRIVTTYGMSETAGGCIYDGRPLPGVRVRIEESTDRIWLGGPMLAEGYVDEPDLTQDRFRDIDGQRWFRTDDRGAWASDERLRVLGRLDDVIITGGAKVEPRDVEHALRTLPQISDAVVMGIDGDAEWGQSVAALVARTRPADRTPCGQTPDDPRPGIPAPDLTLEQVREHLRGHLPAHALPRRMLWRDAIPHLTSGKPDRQAIRDLLT